MRFETESFVVSCSDTNLQKNCFYIAKTVIKPDQRIKKLFPEDACLFLSPHMFWNNNVHDLVDDGDVLHTINQYEAKPIETSQSIKGAAMCVYFVLRLDKLFKSASYTKILAQ